MTQNCREVKKREGTGRRTTWEVGSDDCSPESGEQGGVGKKYWRFTLGNEKVGK